MGIGKRLETHEVEMKKENEEDSMLVHAKYSLSELIISSNTSASISDFLSYKKHENLIFNEWGLSKTHKYQRQTAINFYGPPGTGKTMAAHAIAMELGQPLLIVDYASLESKYVGETSKNIAEIFKKAKETQAIIFFDEADAILSRRVTNMTHATNFIENYDPAFMRRILAHIEFELPDILCRQRLWKKYIPESLPSKAEIKELAEISETLSGSDISNCVLKAAMSAARQNSESILIEHFEKSIKEVINSKNANSKSNTKIEKKAVSETYVESQIGTEKMMELKA